MREDLALAIEDFVVDFISGIARIPGRFYSACREVGRLFGDTFDGAPGGKSAFESEIAELIAPHLAVLVHKRRRMFVADDEGAVQRWLLDLRGFIDSTLIPVMGANRTYAERNRGLVTDFLDRLIAREQSKPAEQSTGRVLPCVTPFDSGWVT